MNDKEIRRYLKKIQKEIKRRNKNRRKMRGTLASDYQTVEKDDRRLGKGI